MPVSNIEESDSVEDGITKLLSKKKRVAPDACVSMVADGEDFFQPVGLWLAKSE